jgi:hypothetical protein
MALPRRSLTCGAPLATPTKVSTLGPTTGRLLAEMMTGEVPFLDPKPFRGDRF